MKRFAGRVLALIGLSLALLMLLNASWTHSNIYKNYLVTQETLKFESVPMDIQIANFGSSHGRDSFIYSNTPKTGFNFALGSQVLVYDDLIMDYYEKHFATESIVFLPVSYFSLYTNELTEDNFNSKNLRYYSFLDRSHIRECEARLLLKYRYCWVLTRDSITLLNDLVNCRNEIPLQESQYEYATDMTSEELEAEGLEAYERHWKSVFEHGAFDNREQENITALVNIIERCQSNGLIPVLVTTPYLECYHKHYSQDFLDSFYLYVYELCEQFGIIYLDYATDERFYNSPELFKNSDHLNRDGALLFTEIVLEDVQQTLAKDSDVDYPFTLSGGS